MNNMEAERGRAGLTKRKVAKMLGITAKTYDTYIKTKKMPTDKLLKLCEIYGCSADYLLERTDKR